ncbi:glutathione S-transferase [Lyticum sinuosum]|uniref:Glutathione S-transferase family protein n=1 Tax=Lyticum sinuosum TaxID=1332059 RepID=A0AAE4VLV3_9RICK|nr:glutathione S-transferase [Lyticum sinuosum]MDZ5761216.1 Glutathione S-transferase family protein [Lyticum sinuosum]
MTIQLYHCNICPLSRFIVLLFKELKIEFTSHSQFFWRADISLIKINALGTRPTAVIGKDNDIFIGVASILSCIEDNFTSDEDVMVRLFGKYCDGKKNIDRHNSNKHHIDQNQDHNSKNIIKNNIKDLKITINSKIKQKSQIKQFFEWFCYRLYQDGVRPLIHEKITKVIENSKEQPNSSTIRQARKKIKRHLIYIEYLLTNKDQLYISGDEVTIADYAATAQISVLDMINEIDWSEYRNLRNWYALMKSRPSTQWMLSCPVPTILRCPNWYTDPDNF